jgi:hypothetical protein
MQTHCDGARKPASPKLVHRAQLSPQVGRRTATPATQNRRADDAGSEAMSNGIQREWMDARITSPCNGRDSRVCGSEQTNATLNRMDNANIPQNIHRASRLIEFRSSRTCLISAFGAS